MFRLPLGDDAFLEKVELRHAPAFHQVTAPVLADLRRYYAVSDSEEAFRAWIAQYRDLDAEDAGLACGIWRGDALLGMISLLEVSRHYLSCTLGCWMITDARGRGLAGRATRAITTYAFEALLLERVVIRVATDNFISQRIPERLGFRYEGVARSAEVIGDRFLDVAIYAMLASDWAGACERGERYPVRPASPEDALWVSGIPKIASTLPAPDDAMTLVVPELAVLAVGIEGRVGSLCSLGRAPGADAALQGLFARAEGDLRRKGVAWIHAQVDPNAGPEHASPLQALGFIPMGEGVLFKAIGDLGLQVSPRS